MSELPWMESAILAPLLGALLCIASTRGTRTIAALASLATATAAVGVAASVFAHGTTRTAVSGWPVPLGIQLRADGLSALMLVTFSVVGVHISAHAIAHFSGRPARARSFFPLWLFAWAGLNALLVSGDVFNLYVTLELTTLAATALVATQCNHAALSSALRYLLFAIAGSLLYLLGIALLYGAYGVLDIELLSAALTPSPTTSIAFSLIAVGLAIKAPLFPLHGWLPGAYASAPLPSSALLSAVIGKAAVYIVLRMWLALFAATARPGWTVVIGGLGAVGVLWAATAAFRQQRLRLLIAYSSISQLGYVFLIFPLHTANARAGVVYLAISHACATAAMFMAAGTIEEVVGHDDIDRLRGLAHHIPVTFVAFALAGASVMGLPPSGGFIAKWLLARAALEQHEWWWAAVVVLGGLLSAAYVFRVLRGAFLPAPVAPRLPTSRATQLVALALALVALGLGLAPSIPLALLSRGAPS